MEILEKPIEWYVEQMSVPFSFPGYSDAELFSMVGEREGSRTGYGQLITQKVELDLLRPLLVHHERFFPAVPKVLKSFPQWAVIHDYFEKNVPSRTYYERDMVTDELSEKAGLYPFIAKLQEMKVGIVGNKALRGLDFLYYESFYEIEPQDFHLNRKGMEKIVKAIRKDSCDIYLFAGGISATVMIGMLHGSVRATLFDIGSSFDAFVGIGAQREWRDKLYQNPKALTAWINKNIHGKS